MLILHYRTLPENTSLPIDQRWRTLELEGPDFDGLDLTQPQGVSAAIRRIMDGKVPNVQGIPYGSVIYLTDTDKSPNWEISISINKADQSP